VDSLLLIGGHEMLPFQRPECSLVTRVWVIDLAARLKPLGNREKLMNALKAPVAQPSGIEVEELVYRPRENQGAARLVGRPVLQVINSQSPE
jgi:hypothetical protein